MARSLDFNKHSKTKKGRTMIVEHLGKENNNSRLLERDRQCWALYNNTSDTEEFEYLTKIGEYELRRIPIQRSKANVLISQQSLRPIKYSSSIIDDEGRKQVIDRTFKYIMGMISSQTIQKREMISAQQAQLDQQKQMLGSQMQSLQQQNQQQPSPELEADIQQLQQYMVQFEVQYNTTSAMIKDQMKIADDEKTKVSNMLQNHYQDVEEVIADKLIKKYITLLDIDQRSTESFINKIVTGREFYYVNYKPGNDIPDFQAINTSKVIYPSIESVKWVQDGPWVILENWMTKEQIRKHFNLRPNERAALDGIDEEYYVDYREGTFIARPGDRAVDVPDGSNTVNSDIHKRETGIRVREIWWRADYKISGVESPNKYVEDGFFTNFINDKPVVNSQDYSYNSKEKTYTSKTNADLSYNKSDVYLYNPDKGERPITRYADVRYHGAIIGEHIVFEEVDPVQPRMTDDFKTVPLPIVGPTYNGIGEFPYSLFWASNELQQEYWVVNYHKELTFALAGASGVVFDLSQKPDGMDDDEWFYHMKLGRYLIQTISKTGQKKNTGYNQFSKVDQTLPQSIQYFDAILEGLDMQIGMVMGVPRQRMGEVRPSDQVGTFSQSNEQATLMTEIIFNEHDIVLNKAITQLLNIVTQYVVKPDQVLSLTGEGVEFLRIPLSFGERRFNVKLDTTIKKERDLVQMKTIALELAQKGAMNLEFIFELFTIDTLKELKMSIESQLEQQREIAQKQASEERSQLIEAEQQAEQADKEFQANMKSIDAKLKEADQKIETLKVQQDGQLGQQKLIIESQKVAGSQELELGAQQEEQRKNVVNERLKQIELQLEAMLKSTGVNKGLGISGSGR